MSTNVHLKREIIKQLGFFPSFLTPAINNSQILNSLYQQTVSAYTNNPLPAIFKEKLFVNLSRYFQIDYLVICHSCTLHSLGVTAEEILALDKLAIPQTESELESDFQVLTQQNRHNWHDDQQLENIMLRCAALIFVQPDRTATCGQKLKQLLGDTDYNYLVLLLGYIKFCHQWIIAHPEISYQQDPRTQLYLAPLLLEDVKLADFFQLESVDTAIELTIAQTTRLIEPTTSKPNQKEVFGLDSQQLKKCLIDAPFPIAIYEERGRILHLNKHWTEITGFDLPQIPTIDRWKQKAAVKQQQVGQSRQLCRETESALQKIISSLDNLSQDERLIDNRQKTSTAVCSEVSIVTSNGEQRVWELYATPLAIWGRDNKLTIAIAKDITNFIHNEAKLAELETKLKLVLEATKTGNWNWNLATNQVEICHRARAILGLENFNNSYESFLASIYVTERESVDLAAIKAIKAGKDLTIEYRIVKPDNTVRWIQAFGKLSYDRSGKANYMTGVVTDITETKSSNRQLQKLNRHQQQDVTQSLDELENLLDMIPYYLFVVDVKTNCISVCNLGLAQSLGFMSSQQVQGKAIADCFPPENTRHIVAQHQQVLQSQTVLRIQEPIVLPDGNHYFDTVITPLTNAEGEIYALLHTSSDIPDLATAQQALSERTNQLEAANKELESFSYSVSHDLQAPLRRINSFSEILWDQYNIDLDDRAKHYLQRIQANSERMSGLIDSLLQLSRITRSKMEYSSVNLSAIATEIAHELQAASPQRKVEFTIAPQLSATGDPQLLRIVLNNLLGNAWKYTSKQVISQIEFDASLDPEEDKIIYFVRDNGAGFDSNYVSKLFTAFQRLHSETEFPGTGIGLATVQRIIYRHGGKVWAEGAPKQGATFYFSL